jgi:hypothetical protein
VIGKPLLEQTAATCMTIRHSGRYPKHDEIRNLNSYETKCESFAISSTLTFRISQFLPGTVPLQLRCEVIYEVQDTDTASILDDVIAKNVEGITKNGNRPTRDIIFG